MNSAPIIAATVCSGIGAPEVAMPNWRYAFQSEIEAFPRAVLQQRHGAQDARYRRDPGSALWGDFTAIRVRFLRRLGIDLPHWIIAGTPCQAFSLAGLRQSLADDRGNLTLEFVRLVHALRRAGSLRGFTWENVPGVLSTKDNAFGCFLAAVVGADAPLCSPLERGRWPDSGMVAGPWARLAWRVFDAQYFGLAQRRRRVFVVASFGNGPDPVEILFERQGMHGNHPPRRGEGQDASPSVAGCLGAGDGARGWRNDLDQGAFIPVAGTLESRTDGGGFPGTDGACSGHDVPADMKQIADTVPTLDASFGRLQGCAGQDANHGHGHLVAFGGNNSSGHIDGATAVNAHGGPHGRCDFESETFVAVPYSIMPMNSGKDYKAFETNVAQPLMAGGPVGGNQGGDVIAYQTSGNCGAWETGDITGAIDTNTDPTSHVVAGVGFAENQRGELRTSQVVNLTVGGGKPGQGYPAAHVGSAVRRLTPRECERLQGFPDDFTAIRYRGKPAADGPRYQALGNSMAVPCMRWIGERIEAAMVKAAAERQGEAA